MNTRTILIVDDQAINRKILHRLLQNDYQIMEAENGRLALECLRANADTISAVLLDIVMPVLDGYGVLQAMHDDPQLSKIPVIVSSMMDSDEAEEKALSLGAQDFIAKPYKANIIRHRLNNTISFRESAAMINKVERDEMTGLLSKQFFLERVSEQLRQNPNEQYDIICLGIEQFKLLNDTYGEEMGDNLLRFMGKMLHDSKDAILTSRFMADHFYLLVPHVETYTNDVFKPYEKQLRKFPLEMVINVKCGIYPITDVTVKPNEMCDHALLASDSHWNDYGKLFCVYDEQMRQRLLQDQFITANMHTAIKEHQFKVYYQPKYDLSTEKIAGAEALVRWIHPEKGFMSPGEFIPLFEHNGFITQLDEYVWEQACQDIRSWLDKGYPPVAVSVNVSRADVYNPNLATLLKGLVEKYKIPVQYLHLEITESAYTNNPGQIIKTVENLRQMGFLIEMDDFGSGYSSLNMLAEMPVDIMKLDMGFVRQETNNPSGKGIMSFVISLAKWLNLAVVAEGVETADQISTLRSMDCNYVQGYYYAKPMPREDFEKLLQSGNVTEMVAGSQPQQVQEKIFAPNAKAASSSVMLIVDDVELNRAVLASTFEGWFQIVEKEDGQQAWEYLQKNHAQVAIVLLDLLMPVMDGFHLLKKIRANEGMKGLPVIITSQGDADSETRALEMQANDFISKPYDPLLVQHRVSAVLESNYLHKLQAQSGMNLLGLKEPKENAMARMNSALYRLVDEYTEVNLETGRFRQMTLRGDKAFSAGSQGEYEPMFAHMCESKVRPADVPEIEAHFSLAALRKVYMDNTAPERYTVRYHLQGEGYTRLVESTIVFLRGEQPPCVAIMARAIKEDK